MHSQRTWIPAYVAQWEDGIGTETSPRSPTVVAAPNACGAKLVSLLPTRFYATFFRDSLHQIYLQTTRSEFSAGLFRRQAGLVRRPLFLSPRKTRACGPRQESRPPGSVNPSAAAAPAGPQKRGDFLLESQTPHFVILLAGRPRWDTQNTPYFVVPLARRPRWNSQNPGV